MQRADLRGILEEWLWGNEEKEMLKMTFRMEMPFPERGNTGRRPDLERQMSELLEMKNLWCF